MYLSRLKLEQFRSYTSLDLPIQPAGLRITGRNASGKTSLLEAVMVLATTRSPRATSDAETINWSSGEEFGVPPYARLDGAVMTRVGARTIAVQIQAENGRAKKTFQLNGRDVRAHDLVGTLKAVLFSPEDVELVSGPPAERRRQLDVLISQIDGHYLRALTRYRHVHAQRNGLLKAFARDRVRPDSPMAVTQIAFWDEQLVTAGAYIIAVRLRLTAELGRMLEARAADLIDRGVLAVSYEPRLDLVGIDQVAVADAIGCQQMVAAAFARNLEAVRAEEFRRGMTVIGPHRDGLTFTIDGRDLAAYGSRGQQRLCVVAFKLAESDLIMAETEERPVLLLDDVLSELDDSHRARLLSAIARTDSQLIVTSADPESLADPALRAIPEVEARQGEIVT